MEERLLLSKEFIDVLDKLKADTNKALIYTIHILSSRELAPEKKEIFCIEISDLGKELRNTILKLEFKSITSFTIRERERAFINSSEGIHNAFNKLFERVDKKYNIVIDNAAVFNLPDIIKRLKEQDIHSGYLLTRDKIDNLLSVKTLIIEIYENQIHKAMEKEKNNDKQFIELKEKTFMQGLHNDENINSIYYFKSTEIVKKLISKGTKVVLAADAKRQNADTLVYIPGEGGNFSVHYSWNGLALSIKILKYSDKQSLRYTINGFIEKGVAKINYVISESVSFDHEVSFEHVSGTDFMLEQYEKAVIEEESNKASLNNKEEQLNKNIIDKAIDDILFG